MAIELKVPPVGESISEVEIGGWLKSKGDEVRKDEPVVTLESEKATVELPSPEAGRLTQVLKQKGEIAKIGEVIAMLEPQGQPKTSDTRSSEKGAEKPSSPASKEKTTAPPRVMPAAERLLAEHDLKADEVPGTGPGGRILKEDVVRHVEQSRRGSEAQPSPTPEQAPAASAQADPATSAGQSPATTTSEARDFPPASVPKHEDRPGREGREEEVVPMSRLRRTIADRLVQAQHTAALLTTFNEVDLGGVMALRKEFGEAFQRQYNVKLGFMSFFVKACVDALKQFPALNAEVRGTNIIYHNYYDIGVAVGGGKGLVVPVIRNAEHLSFAQIEITIADLGRRAKENKLSVDELQGGTFTISNGGVYGSMLSTPIVNPPQSGVLGMHAIQDRPVARDGMVVVRPMMFLALTYDHRIVDGREAVSFLKRIKDIIENPARMLIEI